jgi:hypothetical protein
LPSQHLAYDRTVNETTPPVDAQPEPTPSATPDLARPEAASISPLVFFGDDPDLVCVDDTCLPPSVEA